VPFAMLQRYEPLLHEQNFMVPMRGYARPACNFRKDSTTGQWCSLVPRLAILLLIILTSTSKVIQKEINTSHCESQLLRPLDDRLRLLHSIRPFHARLLAGSRQCIAASTSAVNTMIRMLALIASSSRH
jgi:hypothetical protein